MLGGAAGEVGAFAEVAIVDVDPESLGESGCQRGLLDTVPSLHGYHSASRNQGSAPLDTAG